LGSAVKVRYGFSGLQSPEGGRGNLSHRNVDIWNPGKNGLRNGKIDGYTLLIGVIPGFKMYFLLKIEDIPASYVIVYQRVVVLMFF